MFDARVRKAAGIRSRCIPELLAPKGLMTTVLTVKFSNTELQNNISIFACMEKRRRESAEIMCVGFN